MKEEEKNGKKWWSKSVEGLLSTGPTLSSFHTNLLFLRQFKALPVNECKTNMENIITKKVTLSRYALNFNKCVKMVWS